jgi:hypothetical protein
MDLMIRWRSLGANLLAGSILTIRRAPRSNRGKASRVGLNIIKLL